MLSRSVLRVLQPFRSDGGPWCGKTRLVGGVTHHNDRCTITQYHYAMTDSILILVILVLGMFMYKLMKKEKKNPLRLLAER